MATINATPLANDLWVGIAGHFDSISQVICEFVDNSISNLVATRSQSRSILVSATEVEAGNVLIQVEDMGGGIGDLTPAMRLGDKSIRQTPLNEHGFGLKHALASANPSNDEWVIYTRTKDDFAKGIYRRLSAPYDFHMDTQLVQASATGWPGIYNGTGTLVQFSCSRSLFDTIQRGIKGQAGFQRCLDYLVEELGYVYAGIIEKGQATITVAAPMAGYNKIVEVVKPAWVDYYPPGSGTEEIDLGGGRIKVEYQFGEMRESEYVKHYKRNQSTSGAEIRINGRVVMSNLFKDIWRRESHPSYNHFLVILNLASESAGALPKTRTTKNGIRGGDPKLEELFGWIRKTHPSPPQHLAGAQSEKELVEKVAEYKEKHIRSKSKHIEPEFEVFKTLGSAVSVDLYVFDGKDVVLYEAKKDTADMQNVYQLLMYWDGAVEDGINPAEGILLASDFSPGVDTVLEMLNSRTDRRGCKYNFSKKTWRDEGVPYPEKLSPQSVQSSD